MALSGLVCRQMHAAFLGLTLLWMPPAARGLFRDCGGDVSEERGFLHSPNFPHPFPDPVSCTWVLRAPPGKKIHLHFTQYFLRESFYLAEFDSYTSPTVFTGRSDLGPVDFREHIRSVVGLKPVLSIEFRSWGKKNIHMRVEEFLTDVYGFNVTYEMVDAAEPLSNGTCSVSGCSFLGHCYVRWDWSEYYCACFPGYYGPQCQFGPHCDPKAGRNMCLNGGACRYFYGSYVNMCVCPPGFTGTHCETATENTQVSTPDEECSKLQCSQLCGKQPGAARVSCSCHLGFRLSDDNVTCLLIELHRVTVSLYTTDSHYTQENILSPSYGARSLGQLNRILQFYGLPAAQRFRIDSYSATGDVGHTLRFHFYIDSRHVNSVTLLFSLLSMRGKLFNLTLVYNHLLVRTSPELHLLSVENYERRAAPEGSFSNLVCRARGSSLMTVRWYKDGRLVNASLTTRNVWHSRLLEEGGHTHMSILNINDITIYDKGIFTCEVEDYGEVQRQDVTLDVVMSPTVVIIPRAANVREGQLVSFRCFSPDQHLRPFSYSWKKNGKSLEPGENLETAEDVQPSGKRLTVPFAQESANYTCDVTDHVISTSSTVRLFVTDNDERCDKSRAKGILWEPSVHGGIDVQRCPRSMHGLARRTCHCILGNCTWSTPNFARCQTSAFIAVFDKTELLRLGYQGQSLADIYVELLSLLQNVSADDIVAGDITLASRMILNGMTTAVDIPDVIVQPKTKMHPELLLQLLSLLMNLGTGATPEERGEQKILTRSLLTMEMISELLETALPQLKNGYFRDAFIEAEIKEYRHYLPSTKSAGPISKPLPPRPATRPTNTTETSSPFPGPQETDAPQATRAPLTKGNAETSEGKTGNESRLSRSARPGSSVPDSHRQAGTTPPREEERKLAEVNETRAAKGGNSGPVDMGDNLRETRERPSAQGRAEEGAGSRNESGGLVSGGSELGDGEGRGTGAPGEHEPDFPGGNARKPASRSEGAGGRNGTQPVSGKPVPGSLTDGEDYIAAEPFQVLEIVHTDSMRLMDFSQAHDSRLKDWLPLTHMRSVLPIGGLWRSERFRTKLTFHHSLPASTQESDETACFALTNHRHTLEQEWSGWPCEVTGSGTNFTTCLCSLPVHVVVFVKANVTDQAKGKSSVGSAILLMGCISALCAVSVTLLSYLLAYRYVTSVFHLIRLNTIGALVVLLALCVTCLQGRHLAILCLTSRLLLHLTLLAIYSFLFVDAIHTYIVIHSVSARLRSQRCWTFLTIGWGIPMLSVCGTAVTSTRYGYNDKCYIWCWVEPSTWQFYPFLVPVLVLVLACVLIWGKCVWTVHTWTDEWRYSARRRQLLRTSKNGAILVLLLGVTWSGCDVESNLRYGQQIAFVCLLLILVVVIAISFCASDKTVIGALCSLFTLRARRLGQNSSSHSFRAFIMPEKIADEASEGDRRSTEAQTIHRLCTQRDVVKYTSAKKRELRFLLGSSSSASSDGSGESGHLRHSSGGIRRPPLT